MHLRNGNGSVFSSQITIRQPVNIQNNPGVIHVAFGATWNGSNYYITEMSFGINGNSHSVSPSLISVSNMEYSNE